MGMGEGQKTKTLKLFATFYGPVTTHLPDFTIVRALSLIGCFLVITGKY